MPGQTNDCWCQAIWHFFGRSAAASRLRGALVSTITVLAAIWVASLPAEAQFVCDNTTAGEDGDSAVATGSVDNLACGRFADARGNLSSANMAIGALSNSSGLTSQNLAVGVLANATGDGSRNIASGYQANANGANSMNIATGQSDASGAASRNISTGAFSNASGNNSRNTAIGQGANASGNSSSNIATGNLANAGGDGSRNIAIGDGANASGNSTANTAVGRDSTATGAFSSAFGANSQATGFNAAAFGTGASAAHANATAIGAGAQTTRANQQAFGTASNTYTMAGLTSDASKSAQGAPTRIVTTNEAGDLAAHTAGELGLATLGNLTGLQSQIDGLAQRDKELADGIAVSLALAQPILMPGQTFAIRVGYGNFDSSSAVGVTAAGVLARGIAGPTSSLVLDAGIGFAPDSDMAAGRAGVTLGW